MARLTLAGTAVALAGAVLCLAGQGAWGESRNVVVGRPAPPPKTAKTIKRTWQSGPATTPPEVEIVSRRTAFPVPLKPLTSGPGEGNPAQPAGNSAERAEASRQLVIHNASPRTRLVPRHAPPGARQPVIATIDDALAGPTHLDPEARARSDLNGLQNDPQARQAFYEELRRTADRVRADEQDQKEPNPTSADNTR